MQFVQNQGQVTNQHHLPNPAVLFLMNQPGMNVQLRRGGFSYDLYQTSDQEDILVNDHLSFARFHRIDFDLVDSDIDCGVTASDPSPGCFNYYTAGTPEKGLTGVKAYGRVICNDVYPGISLDFMTDERNGFKYNFTLRPGVSIDKIRLKISGAVIRLSPAGSLIMKTSLGTVEETIPRSHYLEGSEEVMVSVRFLEITPGVFGFATDQPIPADATLIIDPVPDRLWGTYYGGFDYDAAFSSTVDNAGCIYMTGRTQSLDNIATTGSHQTEIGGLTDGFLAKFTPEGNRIWATYYGGGNNDMFFGISMTPGHDLVVSGVTSSGQNISTPGSFQSTLGSIGASDAFLVKFDTAGVRIWGTYYGGSLDDSGYGVACDAAGNIYLSGVTRSSENIATPGSHQSLPGLEADMFLVKFTSGGNRIWGTYYGGECDDYAGNLSSCAIDGNDNVYICGSTCSLTSISTAGSFQTGLNGGADGFLVRFDTSGVRQWGTYFGGPLDDRINHVGISTDHRIIIAGEALSQTGIASPGAFQTSFGGGNSDGFLGRFYPDGQRHWSTYYGGSNDDVVQESASDANGNLFFCGYTKSLNSISTAGVYQPVYGGGNWDGMLMKFDSAGGRIWGTYYGGEGNDWVYSVERVAGSQLYITGATSSLTNIATAGSQQPIYGGGIWDAMLVKFTECTPPVITITGNTTPFQNTQEIYSTQAGMTGYQWTFSTGGTLVSGGTTSDPFITILWNSTGAQWVRVNYTNSQGCSATTPDQLDITVLPSPVTIGFTVPDTTCIGNPITILNTTTGGTTFYWNFCSGSANVNPTGSNIGNPGSLLNIPTYITLVQQGTECFSFISCQGVGVIRYYHGSSFTNAPVNWTNLGTFGLISFSQEGIQVKYDNGNWYGFVNSNNTMIRLNFGNSLWNAPTATDIGPFPSFNLAHGLVILREGTTWIGFVTCSTGQNLIRLDFGDALSNIPVVTDFGSFGGVLVSPAAICMVQENSMWYAMIMAGGNTLARITFGSSLMNIPTGVNLGNPGGFSSAAGLTLLRDCESTTGYWTNYLVNGQLGKLTFPAGITGTVTGTILGNVGGLARPHSFSEIFRQHDTLFAYITNRENGTLTRLTFPPCNNASVPSSTLFNPPSFSYNIPGTYNIHLIVDEGLPTMSGLCKPVVVMDPPSIDLGNDSALCPGNSLTLNAGSGFGTYLWSTGETTPSIVVTAPGEYRVIGTKWDCNAADTILIALAPVPDVSLGNDTTVCDGIPVVFDAGSSTGCTYQWDNLSAGQMNIGTLQTYIALAAGQYRVTKTGTNGCFNRDTVELEYNPQLPVSVTVAASAGPVCAGTPVTFTASATNGGAAPMFQWKINGFNAGTNNPVYEYLPLNGDVVTCELTSDALCATGNPALSNPLIMAVMPLLPVSVSIAASNNPVCGGISVTYTASPLNGGTSPAFQWKVNGSNAGTNNAAFQYTPANGDSVRCMLTSNIACPLHNPISSNTINMQVSAPPIVTFSACFDTITQVNAKPFRLRGGIPLGGIYSGPGVNPSSGVFTPSAAGTGTKTITYTYTNAALCQAASSLSIINYPISVHNCGTTLTDIRDHQLYQTVQIGTQCWFAANLNFGTMIPGSVHQRDNCLSEKYCYNDLGANCSLQGAVYQWDEIMRFEDVPGQQGLCPPGWHIPTSADWNTLFANWTNNGFAGAPLKYSGYSGFNALLGGVNHLNKQWDFSAFSTFFWSSTPYTSGKAWAHGMNDFDPSVSLYPSFKTNAFSVRCIRD